MNPTIISALSSQMKIKDSQVKAVLDLLEEGATIPFIARYRKEQTGNLDEDQIREIETQFAYQQNLLKRKEDVIRLIEEKGLMNDRLKNQILQAERLVDVEDLYRPYKEKKKTKATAAYALGLAPLAKEIISFPKNGSLESLAQKYVNEKTESVENVLEQTGYIIAEVISDNASIRKYVRNILVKEGTIETKKKKDAEDEKGTYSTYYEWSSPVHDLKHFRYLALNRAENEKVVTVSINIDEDMLLNKIYERISRGRKSFVSSYIKQCVKDSLKRLMLPSIKREIRKDLMDDASQKAIATFQINLEHLLLARPIKQTRILGFDPGYAHGCKLAVIDENGNLLETAIVYPVPPREDFETSRRIVLDLIDRYNVELVALGNGTASRESEAFIIKLIKERPNLKYVFVSEAGASVYSASPLAAEEFPDLTVEKRSAISIGRRIQDPLSELVKIDPKSIGIGEYQHDVNQKELNEALDFTTEKVVNQVGVNINTASASILKHVSGLNKTHITKLLNYKKEHPFHSRSEVADVKGISDKVYEQCIGFLRIPESKNPLDNTGIHPESYELAANLLKLLNLDIHNLNTPPFKEQIQKANAKKLASSLNSDIYTISDILKELANPGLDPRDSLPAPLLKSDVLTIEDLKEGMELEGTVRNVTSFGAFVDIGLHSDGLIHISRMANRFVSNPNDIVHVGQIVKCKVVDIDLKRERVGLSLV